MEKLLSLINPKKYKKKRYVEKYKDINLKEFMDNDFNDWTCKININIKLIIISVSFYFYLTGATLILLCPSLILGIAILL